MSIIKICYFILLGMAGGYIALHYLESSTMFIILICAAVAILLSYFSIRLSNRSVFSGGILFSFFLFVIFGFEAVFLFEIIVAIASIFKVSKVQHLFKQFGLAIIAIAVSGNLYLLLGGEIGALFSENIMAISVTMVIYSLMNGLSLTLFDVNQLTSYQWAQSLPKLKEASLMYFVSTFLSVRLAFQYNQNNIAPFLMDVLFYVLLCLLGYYMFYHFKQIRKSYLTSLESLTDLMETKLSLKKGHSRSVGKIARKIAQELQLSKAEVNEIHTAALLHDIGKMAMNEKFIHKKEAMKIAEIENYEKHVLYGEKVVREMTRSPKVASYVLYHHEHWDGKGFPKQLKGEEIPLGARIISIANEMEYLLQKNRNREECTEFSKMAYKKLDPHLVRLVLDIDLLSKIQRETPTLSIEEEKESSEGEEKKRRESLDHSKVLDSYPIDKIVYYDGAIKDIHGVDIQLPEQKKMIKYARIAINKQQVVRCFIEPANQAIIYDLYCIPKDGFAILIFFNVSNLLQIEQKQDYMVHSIYSDVMYAVTQKKLLLLDDEEIKRYSNFSFLYSCSIQTTQDIPKCRKWIEELCHSLNLSNKLKFNLLLCTSEITTNVLKHANEGVMEVYIEEDVLRIIVKDNGNGIELSDIPRSTLLAGYSSKASLGHGFSLVLKLIDKLILSTSSKGTTIILEQKIEDINNKAEPPNQKSAEGGEIWKKIMS